MPSSNYRLIVVALGIVGVLSGIALLLLPFRLAGDGDVTAECRSALAGAFGDRPVASDGSTSLDCAPDARSRAVLGVAFVGGGVGAVALVNRKTRRPDASIPTSPVPPSWEATGGPPPAR